MNGHVYIPYFLNYSLFVLCGYHLKAVSFDADINEMGSYTWIYLTMIQLVLVCIVLTCWTLYSLMQFDD